MVSIEIVEGIKQAVKRGDSLKQAMMSFFNAGYDREEIQDAARVVQNTITETPILKKAILKGSVAKNTKKKIKQNVSSYGAPKAVMETSKKASAVANPLGKIMIFVLIFIFVILGVFILSVIFFKEEAISIFSNIFG